MLPVSLFNVARYLTDSLRGPVLQTLHQIATVSLRGSGQIYTRGPKGRVYVWDGWMGDQKCPSMLFILCEYIEHVHVYLYIFSKIVTYIPMGFNVKLGIGPVFFSP